MSCFLTLFLVLRLVSSSIWICFFHTVSSQVVVGHVDQESESLAKNIVTCFEKIQKEVPGGLQNIRNAQIKCGNSLAVPLFVSFGKNAL